MTVVVTTIGAVLTTLLGVLVGSLMSSYLKATGAGGASQEPNSPERGMSPRETSRTALSVWPPVTGHARSGIMCVIFDHVRPSGHIMADMQGDRGTVP
jgi:hypothetical protein